MLAKHIRALMVTLFFGLSWTMGIAQTPENIVTPKDPTYSFQLVSNATTGYSWQVAYYDKKLLTLKEHHYVAPESSHLVGAPGYEVWQFEATPYAFKTAPHSTTIKMVYMRAWEKNIAPSTIKTLTLKINKK